jgi:hypothetical protein
MSELNKGPTCDVGPSKCSSQACQSKDKEFDNRAINKRASSTTRQHFTTDDTAPPTGNGAAYPIDGATVFDCEVAPNYTLIMFMEPGGTVRYFEHTDNNPVAPNELRAYLDGRLLAGFNSSHYDDHIVRAVLDGKSVGDVYKKSKELIHSRWVAPCSYPRSIDLMACVPQVSLKMLAIRMRLDKCLDAH